MRTATIRQTDRDRHAKARHAAVNLAISYAIRGKMHTARSYARLVMRFDAATGNRYALTAAEWEQRLQACREFKGRAS